MKRLFTCLRRTAPALLLPLLSGCGAVVLDPAGDVAAQQRDLLVESTLLMLVIIIPVMVLTVLFAWKYRQSNTEARYEPDWHHSTQLELVIWGAPLLIIICLGALTWMGTHLLDPYRPLAATADARPGDAKAADAKTADAKAGEKPPLEVQVVALDWKWLFFYPQLGVASVNELAAPVDRAIDFKITASSVMNSFFIPALAGQIYAMPGMQTQLHAVVRKPGTYEGFSANYSGAGFSGMRFAFQALPAPAFDAWVKHAQAGGTRLDRAAYLALKRPSENVPARTYAAVESGLYDRILGMCVEPGKMCIGDMAAIDAKGGLGLTSAASVMSADYDKDGRPGTESGSGRRGVFGLCALPPAGPRRETAAAPAPHSQPGSAPDSAPIRGAGLPVPGSIQLPALFADRGTASVRGE